MFAKIPTILFVLMWLDLTVGRPIDDNSVSGPIIQPWSKAEIPISWINVGGAALPFVKESSANSIGFQQPEGFTFFK
jgi:hypothetical protein